MPILQFVDSDGVTWRVWNTVPSSRTALSGEYEKGWLTFESAAARKRLAPIPARWDEAAPDRLELMCQAASHVARTRATTDPDAGVDPDAP